MCSKDGGYLIRYTRIAAWIPLESKPWVTYVGKELLWQLKNQSLVKNQPRFFPEKNELLKKKFDMQNNNHQLVFKRIAVSEIMKMVYT